MGQALSPIADSEILRLHSRLSTRLGRYSYSIVTERGGATYTVSTGGHSIIATLLWAVGNGRAGQTYIYRQNGAFYESRVSYFKETQGLDLTLGHDPAEPSSLETAAGRRLSGPEVLRCFACHSTAAVGKLGLQLMEMMPGVICEGCHGAGSEHVAAIRRGELRNLRIFNPGKLGPEDLADFCGSCHRSPLDVLPQRGMVTVRFHPYRLSLSRCFGTGDSRMSCLVCHNPHEEIHQDVVFYDPKCLACHGGPQASAPVRGVASAKCPVSSGSCITCHMPKVELPHGHFKFTDHYIRVVRPNVPYPG